MGHIINKIRRQQRTALLNREAMEREQRRQQGYPTAFPMLDGQGGIAWSDKCDVTVTSPWGCLTFLPNKQKSG